MSAKTEINTTKKIIKKNSVKIPSTVRNTVWNTYIGNGQKQGICFCCNTETITSANFDCGHIESKFNGGKTTIQNLRPICGLCNKSMGIKNMETFMNEYGFIKNKNWDGIRKDNEDTNDNKTTNNTKDNKKTKKPKDNTEKQNEKTIKDEQITSKEDILNDFLNSLLLKQLQQICRIFYIYTGGTKVKLIEKIIKNKIQLCEIINNIDVNKKYLILCDGFKYCSKCEKNASTGNDLCVDCNKKANSECNHFYYSDSKILKNNEQFAVCLMCNKKSFIVEYDNSFYKKILPIINKTDNVNNTEGILYRYLDNYVVKELQQLCLMFNVPSKGNKKKLIENIIDNKKTKDTINKEINKNKKYIVYCNGFSYCKECKNNIIKETFEPLCNKCTENNIKNKHYIYTNKKTLKDDKYCKSCLEKSIRTINKNEFYEKNNSTKYPILFS